MTDKELLELAAKAAGIEITGLVDKTIAQPDHRTGGFIVANNRYGESVWNPLTDDGDAFRLALKLELFWDNMELFDVYMEGRDHLPMYVRRAIVRAAAEIGKTL